MGDFPLMTETGTFIINGAERVIVSQLVRSPGVYYNVSMDPSGKKKCMVLLLFQTVVPGLNFETDVNDVIYARVDRTRKLPATVYCVLWVYPAMLRFWHCSVSILPFWQLWNVMQLPIAKKL